MVCSVSVIGRIRTSGTPVRRNLVYAAGGRHPRRAPGPAGRGGPDWTDASPPDRAASRQVRLVDRGGRSRPAVGSAWAAGGGTGREVVAGETRPTSIWRCARRRNVLVRPGSLWPSSSNWARSRMRGWATAGNGCAVHRVGRAGSAPGGFGRGVVGTGCGVRGRGEPVPCRVALASVGRGRGHCPGSRRAGRVLPTGAGWSGGWVLCVGGGFGCGPST
jgi:hypothetical protein